MTILHVEDFGSVVNTHKDACASVRAALEAAQGAKEQVTLEFTPGRYDFYPEGSMTIPYWISNTASEEENLDVTKSIGILLWRMNDVVIEGNGSLFIFHGKMTTIVVDQSENVEIRNVRIDFQRPTISEMTVVAIGENYIDFRVHPDSWYTIIDDRLIWKGEGFQYTGGPSQEYDPVSDTTWRTWNPAAEAMRVVELSNHLLRFFYKQKQETRIGNVFQMRDGIRDQVGIFLLNSKNIWMHDSSLHYLHGLGIVTQYCEDLRFERLTFAPRLEIGRTCASFADFLHISGCKGTISVLDCTFTGSHDDPINVHGTHLEVREIRCRESVVVRFMHPQTYGFPAFFEGDTVDFIDRSTLTTKGTAAVQSVEHICPREWLLTFTAPLPLNVQPGDVIENASWTPSVEIKECRFSRVPTRGILVTTRKPVEITNNTFEGMAMEAILIADDTSSWYESGYVTNVVITGNRFIRCGKISGTIIGICPENIDISVDNPVHSNVRIYDNVFEIVESGQRVLYAKSTKGLQFSENIIEATKSKWIKQPNPYVELLACSKINIGMNDCKGTNLNIINKDVNS